MKKRSVILLGMLSAALAAVEVPDLSKFTAYSEKDDTSLFVEGFENPAKEWQFGKGCKIVRNAGMNGNPGLVITRTNPDNYESAVARIRLNVKPGKVYNVTAMYRTENISAYTAKGPVPGGITAPAIEFRKNGKYVSMINPTNRPKNSATWAVSKTTFVASEENYLVLRLFYYKTGTIYFDNIRVEESGSNLGIVYPLQPRESLLDDNGTVEFKTFVWEFRPENLKDHLMVIDLNGTKKAVVPDKNGNAKVQFGKLPDGEYNCTASILDMKNKKIVNQHKFLFSRNTKITRQSYIDEHNRLIVNGKPYFPVGIYYTWVRTEKDLKKIADAGFNNILTYTPYALNIQPEANEISKRSPGSRTRDYGTKEWEANVSRSLDIIQKYNLTLTGATEHEVFLHPVVIGPYTADELSINNAPKLQKKRETFMKKLPGFPVIALTDKPQDYIPYAQFVDVLGIDPYPIMNEKSKTMNTLKKMLLDAKRTGKTIMYVPQAFNWGGHRAKDKAHYAKNFITPTEEQIRSMVLLPLIYDVKWFCFYSYTTIFERMTKFDPEGAEKFWHAAVVPNAKLLRELEPWVLSLEKAPQVTIKNLAKTDIDAKAFSADGKVIVIITSCGPAEGKAEIFVPGKADLKSRFGKVKNLGGGRYLFTGKDIASDILFE